MSASRPRLFIVILRSRSHRRSLENWLKADRQKDQTQMIRLTNELEQAPGAFGPRPHGRPRSGRLGWYKFLDFLVWDLVHRHDEAWIGEKNSWKGTQLVSRACGFDFPAIPTASSALQSSSHLGDAKYKTAVPPHLALIMQPNRDMRYFCIASAFDLNGLDQARADGAGVNYIQLHTSTGRMDRWLILSEHLAPWRQ